jgi:PAS domain S-box-containing protein
MFNEIKIGTKITMLLISVVFISVVAISFISYRLSKDSIEKRYWESLSVIAQLKEKELEDIFKQLEYNLNFIQKSARVQESILQSRETTDMDSMETVISGRLNDYLVPIQEMYGYRNVLLLDIEGKIIYKTNKGSRNQIIGQVYAEYELLREKATNSVFYGDLYKMGKEVYMNVAAPLISNSGALVGYVVAEFNMDKVYQITDDTVGLPRSGEIFIAKMSGSKIDILNKERRAGVNTLLTQTILAGDDRLEALQRACKEEEGFDYTIDQRGKQTMANWRHVLPINWGLIVKIDKEEVIKDLDNLLIAFVMAGCVILFIGFIIAFLFSKFLINPLLELRAALNVVAKGILPDNIQKKSNDEIGEMASSVNNLVAALRRTANFAHAIGEGNYDAHFKPMSHDDILGNALITMRDSIQKSDERDSERNWIVTGVAEISQILRLHNDLEELGSSVISFVVEKIDAVQGAFYVVEEDLQGTPFIEMKASYAYGRKKYLKAKFRFAEGLVGQCAIEQETILRLEIPDDYLSITSGILGDRKPKSLLLVPLITNEKVYGVLEFAGFDRFSSTHISFVEEISVITARTIFNVKVNEKTVKLLQESQQMGEELKIQQDILRQNAEEMAATQEELKRTNARLEEQILEVNRTQKRMQVLLENASEVITIYEKDGKVRYISPSVETILGYTQDEMIGINDIMYVQEESKDEYRALFQNMINEPNKKATVQFEYVCKNGETIWLEATGTNLLADPAIRGLVVNSRDITERLSAEREARLRGQMQSLSENSVDLITRVDLDGTIFYINPVIEHLTNLQPSVLLNTNLFDMPLLNQQLITDLKGIIAEVAQKGSAVIKEVPFSTVKGELIMNVTALPEYNEKKDLETVLLVSHDITERKQTELELLSINKKITESINYAKRIQEAILPNTAIIQKLLPDSFVYYKPRDVVSGDFPWFLYNEETEHIFIAAVDCTGHGVPGALISLIGYFLLNDVVHTKEETNVGQILDMLNAGVTKTLRQDTQTSGGTRDGMDIALCRIHLPSNELQYAGAHRPLYFVKDNEITVIDGDKAPIGGGQLKKRDSFSCTTLTISKGCQFYIFSDGVPDQFGGKEGKKYSPRRLRDVIMLNQGLSMPEMEKAIFDDFRAWQGDFRQTDDLLMIGVRF